MYDHDEEKKGRAKAKNDVLSKEEFTQPQDIAREAIFRDSSRKFKHVLLRFPEQLQAEVFASKINNSQIAPSLVPIAKKHLKTSSTGKVITVAVQRLHIMWPIAALEFDDRDTTRHAGNTLEEELGGLLDGMELS